MTSSSAPQLQQVMLAPFIGRRFILIGRSQSRQWTVAILNSFFLKQLWSVQLLDYHHIVTRRCLKGVQKSYEMRVKHGQPVSFLQ
jgi:hypothetical protein